MILRNLETFNLDSTLVPVKLDGNIDELQSLLRIIRNN